jgi:hypothetical protein
MRQKVRASLSVWRGRQQKHTRGPRMQIRVAHAASLSRWVEGAGEIVVCLLVGERVVREVSERAEPTIYPDPEGPARVIAGAVSEVG